MTFVRLGYEPYWVGNNKPGRHIGNQTFDGLCMFRKMKRSRAGTKLCAMILQALFALGFKTCIKISLMSATSTTSTFVKPQK